MKLVILFTCGLLAIAAVVYYEWYRLPQRKAYLTAVSMARIEGFAHGAESEAAIEPEVFLNFVGTGVVADAGPLLTAMDAGVKPEPLDTFHFHPFHMKLWRIGGLSTGRDGYKVYLYGVQIWSDGPNGRNEFGGGDYVSLTNTIECPVP